MLCLVFSLYAKLFHTLLASGDYDSWYLMPILSILYCQFTSWHSKYRGATLMRHYDLSVYKT